MTFVFISRCIINYRRFNNENLISISTWEMSEETLSLETPYTTSILVRTRSYQHTNLGKISWLENNNSNWKKIKKPVGDTSRLLTGGSL